MRKPTKAIITDAGYASRYLPIAKTVPKGMLPIGNRPIMQLSKSVWQLISKRLLLLLLLKESQSTRTTSIMQSTISASSFVLRARIAATM